MVQTKDGQYSITKIIGLWLLITVPMGMARFWLLPLVENRLTIHPGIFFWLLMIGGMIWQFIVSVIILKIELGKLTWDKLKERLWLNHPIDPKSGRVSKKLYWMVIPVILYGALIQFTGLLNFLSEGLLKMFPFFQPPDYVQIEQLATSEFHGAWYLVGIVLISSLFNYLLGEELFFRGILLPKMNGVFGRWDWVMNGILFASYHMHKIEDVPVFLVSSIFIAYLNKKYKSFYPALLIHGVEFIPLIVMVMLVVLGLVGS